MRNYIPKPELDARFRKAVKIMPNPILRLQEWQYASLILIILITMKEMTYVFNIIII